MNKKIKMKLSTIMMLLLVGVGFFGNSVSMSASAIDPTPEYNDNLYEELLQNGEVVENTGKERAGVALIIAAVILKFCGAVILSAIVTSVAKIGIYETCRRFNDTNRGFDYYCDATNNFRD